MSIGFRFFAQQDANACAVLDPSGRHWTRGELERLANQTARALRDLGLKEGDAIALVSRNRVEYLIVFLAALRSGLHLVPIDWHLAGAEIAYLLKDSRAQALLADSRLRALVSDALLFEPQSIPFLLSFGSMAGFRDFWDVIDSYSAESLEPGVAGQLLQYASATTWRPKGVLVPLTSPDLLRLDMGHTVHLVDEFEPETCPADDVPAGNRRSLPT
jgi:long-chain acyl-CoA synthetase